MIRSTGRLLLTGMLALSAGSAKAGESPDFLAGHWCRQTERGLNEELWFPAVDGETLGMSRSVRNGAQAGFEFMRIARIDGVLTFIAQPGGQAPVHFNRTDGGEGWVRFENPQHDFPTRIEYRHNGAKLEATISGPAENGSRESIDFVFIRCPGQDADPSTR